MAVVDITISRGTMKRAYWRLLKLTAKPHLEFQTSPNSIPLGRARLKSAKDQNRGVYGYVSFGEVIGNEIYWHPPIFLNWSNQILTPPPNTACNAIRHWLRMGVTGYISDIPFGQNVWQPTKPSSWHGSVPPGGHGP